MTIRAHKASDYAGLEFGEYEFYFGYEETVCPKHGRNYGACVEISCDKGEWAFVVRKDKKEIMCVPESKLKTLIDKNYIDEIYEPEDSLLIGIGYYLSQITK